MPSPPSFKLIVFKEKNTDIHTMMKHQDSANKIIRSGTRLMLRIPEMEFLLEFLMELMELLTVHILYVSHTFLALQFVMEIISTFPASQRQKQSSTLSTCSPAFFHCEGTIRFKCIRTRSKNFITQ